ncbi:hypothetical protein DERP_008511 [Dermatophagoides pteronyssinus]|uniref:Uncharacterized protein n=1 Tax=Dermatophagoides pteronyssinus TaxID=6956 RepID=A0ABQ8IVT3_DERPT|nr:hypothetical protein DERP_008511 [Dermatophagoides pteronyssinus]
MDCAIETTQSLDLGHHHQTHSNTNTFFKIVSELYSPQLRSIKPFIIDCADSANTVIFCLQSPADILSMQHQQRCGNFRLFGLDCMAPILFAVISIHFDKPSIYSRARLLLRFLHNDFVRERYEYKTNDAILRIELSSRHFFIDCDN